MNNLTITNNYKDSIIVANLQEKAKDYARHAFAKKKYKASTIQRKISAIYKYCETKNIHINLQDKEFKIVWQGIRRKLGIAKQGKDPILLKDLEEILQHIPKNTWTVSSDYHATTPHVR